MEKVYGVNEYRDCLRNDECISDPKCDPKCISDPECISGSPQNTCHSHVVENAIQNPNIYKYNQNDNPNYRERSVC